MTQSEIKSPTPNQLSQPCTPGFTFIFKKNDRIIKRRDFLTLRLCFVSISGIFFFFNKESVCTSKGGGSVEEGERENLKQGPCSAQSQSQASSHDPEIMN